MPTWMMIVISILAVWKLMEIIIALDNGYKGENK